MFARALAALAVLLLASCGSAGLPIPDLKPYRIEIQQGNYVSQEMVSQLKPGMSKDQVRFVLGTPLITDAFHADRWDYVYRRQKVNSNVLEHRKIAVFFENGKLKRVEGDVKPAGDAGAAAVKAPEAQAAADKSTGPQGVEPKGVEPKGVEPRAAEPGAAAPAASEPAGAASAAEVAPAQPAQGKSGEKSWWQKLKDMF